jgi:hypothetical protein
MNLRQEVSQFESDPAVNADEEFVKVRTQFFADIEGELAKLRLRKLTWMPPPKPLENITCS